MVLPVISLGEGFVQALVALINVFGRILRPPYAVKELFLDVVRISRDAPVVFFTGKGAKKHKL